MICPPQDEFQIGWICALPIEAAAAKEMLDESFGSLDEQDKTDPNTYTLGRIGKHYIVIACLPEGQYGNTAATTVANNMIRTFSKSLRVGLMVGVGGGIPSTTSDIRLGDIVISCPTGNCGGVLQYDMGKVGVDGKFTRTGSLNSPPRSLLAAVSTMRAAELTDDPHYPEYLRNAIGRTRRTQKTFTRPGQQSDRLFKIQHDHPAAADNCDICPREWEEARNEREDNEPQPHYGIIASGNSVIKHGWTREQLRMQTGALCFEMEAAGLMLDFPCIVIRGICDYSDSHKNKEWQGYAALAAASYTKELLGYIPKGQVSQESLATNLCRSLENLNEKVKGTNERLDKAYDQQERYHAEQTARVLTTRQKECHQVFKISNYEQHKDINPDRIPGTCQWALQNTYYLRWWDNCSNDLLWISADPGCGKSVLSKSLIDNDLQECSSKISICYFFFKDNDEQNSLAAALCAILHQLFSQQPSLLRHAVPSWEKNGDKLQQETGELWRILLAVTSDPASLNTICVLDALDECRPVDQNQLIQRLKGFHSQTSLPTQKNWLKFLVTSRPYDDIHNNFKSITGLFPHIHLQGERENDHIHQEINLVVKVKVKELAEISNLPADVEQRIKDQLLQMQHRTYLWLSLAIDDIRTTLQDPCRSIEEAIRMVPTTVSAAYEKILSRVRPYSVNTVRTVLQIIVAAQRPLTTAEMAVALGIAIPSQHTREKQDPTILEENLRQLCGLFIFIKESRIYLLHQTAKEFLIAQDDCRQESTEWRQSVNLQDANIVLSRVCMSCLHESIYQGDHYQQLNQGEVTGKKDGLLLYAATHWISHMISLTNAPTSLLQLAGDLCDPKNLSAWIGIQEPGFIYYRYADEPLPFFWAARWGLIDVARFLLQESQIQITDKIIEKAAAHGSDKDTVIRLLLNQRGEEISITDKVLQEAAANTDSGCAIMELLLDRKGHEIKITEKVMQKAAENEDCGLPIMKLLMSRKIDEIKITSKIMESAAGNWSDGAEMIRYLFEQKGDKIWITPRVLQAALRNPDGAEIVQLLYPRSYLIQKIMRRSRYQRQGRDARKWDKWIKRYRR